VYKSKFGKTVLKSWTDKSGNVINDKNKEPEFSYGRIANPLPYHLTREALLNENISFRFFDGQKDLHSMPSIINTCDIAIPGVNGIDEEMLGLFKGRDVEILFDQDKAGQDGAFKLKTLLEKAGAIVKLINWDSNLGTDINEVLQNGNILKIQQ
jgi:5S rRNA maturation endonuclease (ribonuclease M5)